MTGDEFALDQRVERVRAVAVVTQGLVKMDRRTLGVAQVEIEHQESLFARQLLDLQDDAAADPVTARPGRDKGAGHSAGHRLRLVVARRAGQLGRTADHSVEPADDEAALGDQQHALPVVLQQLARGRLEPAEAAALDNGAFGRLAEVVEIGAGIAGQALDPHLAEHLRLAHGRHRKKLAISRSPACWLFSGWNWVPTRLPCPTAATSGPP